MQENLLLWEVEVQVQGLILMQELIIIIMANKEEVITHSINNQVLEIHHKPILQKLQVNNHHNNNKKDSHNKLKSINSISPLPNPLQAII